jgi:hypothetical protein
MCLGYLDPFNFSCEPDPSIKQETNAFKIKHQFRLPVNAMTMQPPTVPRRPSGSA